MGISVEAVYENGVLKPARPLPLNEHEKVHVTVQRPAEIQAALDAVRRSYGLIRWKGDAKALEHIALDDEFGMMESR